MSNNLYVAWQDSAIRRWYPIGILSEAGGTYSFKYTVGALEAQVASNFNGLQSFPDLQRIYESPVLFPVFRSRLLSVSRPEYDDFIQWLNLPDMARDPIAILARTGGQRETDTLEVFPSPEPNSDGTYKVYFFVHGIRHVSGAEDKVNQLVPGDRLVLTPEPENKFDSWALRLERDGTNVGYCPRYVNKDFGRLLETEPDKCVVQVERVNPEPVPIQFRLLCKFQAQWPEEFVPFSEDSYSPIHSVLESGMSLPTLLPIPHKP